MVAVTRKKILQKGGAAPPKPAKTSFKTNFSSKKQDKFATYVPETSSNSSAFKEKKKGILHSIYKAPKAIFSGIGAIKNVVTTGIKKSASALYSGVRGKGLTRASQAKKIEKKIEERLEKGKTAQPYSLPTDIKNPYQIASDIISQRGTIEAAKTRHKIKRKNIIRHIKFRKKN
jgi:hypothetical protein